MLVKGLNHLAFITPDMEATIRFYRDLLEMDLVSGIGHDGFRHYFFKCGDGAVAFFEYEIAQPMAYDKFHGSPTNKPIGFDHVSFTVDSCEKLFHVKDKLQAANIEVSDAVDHGTIWSIYFFDPINNLPLEASWDCVAIDSAPAILDTNPLPVAEEGASPQPGQWPEVTAPTPPEKMTAQPGNGFGMRDDFVRRGLARLNPDLEKLLNRQRDTNTANRAAD